MRKILQITLVIFLSIASFDLGAVVKEKLMESQPSPSTNGPLEDWEHMAAWSACGTYTTGLDSEGHSWTIYNKTIVLNGKIIECDQLVNPFDFPPPPEPRPIEPEPPPIILGPEA